MTAPDPHSKNSLRKLGSKSKSKSMDSKDSQSANASLSNRNSFKGVKRIKNEIKNPNQIAKERREKEKRREKTGRHFIGKNKNKKKNK